MSAIRPQLAAQKYRAPGDLWGPEHELVVLRHLQEDGFLVVQPKWDGFRTVIHEDVAWSRSGEPLANEALQRFAKHAVLDGFEHIDGEVFSGHAYHPEVFRATTSGIRSVGGSGDIMIVVYDQIRTPQYGYLDRRGVLVRDMGLSEDSPIDVIGSGYHVKLHLCPQKLVKSIDELYAAEAEYLALNFEGAIVRRVTKRYKFGRATALGGELTKVKRGRESYDAKVIGYEEGVTNTNEQTSSALGYAKRSSHQENCVPNGRLGCLQIRWVNGPYSGKQQKVGVFRGLGHDNLRALWAERETLPGRYCEVSVDAATGGYDLGRCPVWLRWRDASEF